MDPLYKNLALQLAPMVRQMPPPPLDQADLERVFSEIRRTYPYQSFSFTPDNRGVIFQNAPDDSIELRPMQIQIQAKLDGPEPLVAESAERKVMAILKAAGSRLEMETFVQCGIQLVALAAVPGDQPDAKDFVATKLMRDVGQADVLGPRYFGGGIKFRSIKEDGSGEDSLNIEPFVQDNVMLYLDHQKVRAAVNEPIRLDQVSTWIGDAFDFVSGPTMSLLTQ